MIKRKEKILNLPSGKFKIRALNMFDFIEAGADRASKEDVRANAQIMKRLIMRAVVEPPLVDDPRAENSIYSLSNDEINTIFLSLIHI